MVAVPGWPFRNRVELTRWQVPWAFLGTSPTDELSTSGLPVILPMSRKRYARGEY
jgi:hypothetical protein